MFSGKIVCKTFVLESFTFEDFFLKLFLLDSDVVTFSAYLLITCYK